MKVENEGMSLLKFAVTACILMLSTVLYAAETEQQANSEHDYYLLQNYKLTYTEEIFDFCVDAYGTTGYKMRSCMIRNAALKKNILSDALDQLGRQSLAQSIYDDCVDYSPLNGVARISECVRTRLDLSGKLQDERIEKTIYKKCDDIWRKHGFRAINNCSVTEAAYYRDKGLLKD